VLGAAKNNVPIMIPIKMNPLSPYDNQNDGDTKEKHSKRNRKSKKTTKCIKDGLIQSPKSEEALAKAIQLYYEKGFNYHHRFKVHDHLKLKQGWMCNNFTDYGYGPFKDFRKMHDLEEVYACLNEGCEKLCITWKSTRSHMAKCDCCPMFLFEEIPSKVKGSSSLIWRERSKLSVQKALKLMKSKGLLKTEEDKRKLSKHQHLPKSVTDLMQKAFHGSPETQNTPLPKKDISTDLLQQPLRDVPSITNTLSSNGGNTADSEPKPIKSKRLKVKEKVSFVCTRKGCREIFEVWESAYTHITGCKGLLKKKCHAWPADTKVLKEKSINKWRSLMGEKNLNIPKDGPTEQSSFIPIKESDHLSELFITYACLRQGCKDIFETWQEAHAHLTDCKVQTSDENQRCAMIGADDLLAVRQSKAKASSLIDIQEHIRRVECNGICKDRIFTEFTEEVNKQLSFSCLRFGCGLIFETWESALHHISECKINLRNGIQVEPKKWKRCRPNDLTTQNKSAAKAIELARAKYFLDNIINKPFIENIWGPVNETELVNAIKDFYARDRSGIDKKHRKSVRSYLRREKGWNDQAMKMIYGSWEKFLFKHGFRHHDNSNKPRVSQPANQPDKKIDSRLGLLNDDIVLKSDSSPQPPETKNNSDLILNSISSNNAQVDTKPAPTYQAGAKSDSKCDNSKPDPMPASLNCDEINPESQQKGQCDPIRMKSSTHMYTTEIHGKLKPAIGSKRPAPDTEITEKSANQTDMFIGKSTEPFIKALCVSEVIEKPVNETNNQSIVAEKSVSQTEDSIQSHCNSENEDEPLTDIQEYYAYLY